MKTDSESHRHKAQVTDSAASAPRQDHLRQELRPQLNVIVEAAELLKTKAAGDENVRQILAAARGLLDVINRESAEPRDRDGAARSEPNERCDVLYIEDDLISFRSVKLLLGNKRKLKVLHATTGRTGIALAQTHRPQLILLDLSLPDIHG